MPDMELYDAKGRLILRVEQETPEKLRHVPYGSDYDAPTYYPLQIDSSGRIHIVLDDYQVSDDSPIRLGDDDDAKLVWETADDNAHALILVLPEGDATNVPVFIIGDGSIENADLGFFNGKTQPHIVVMDDDADSWLALAHIADDQPVIYSNNAIRIHPSGDVDNGFSLSVTANRPLLAAVSGPLVLGLDATATYATNTADVVIGRKIEFKNQAWFIGASWFGANLTVNTDIAIVFGSANDVRWRYDYSSDADARAMVVCLNKAGHTGNVPVCIFGDEGIWGTDLGLFDGITEPQVAVVDDDNDSGGLFGFDADDIPAITVRGAATDIRFKAGQAAGNGVDIQAYDVDGGTWASVVRVEAANEVELGFFGATPVAQQKKANHNNWAAIGDVVNALVNLGLLDAA